MKKIKTNCELPLSMLEKYNNKVNDIDFVLFHLYEESKEYRDYFLQQRQKYPKRVMILDNSAYEYFIKGESLNIYNYTKAINDLSPTFYLVPDVLMDEKETLALVTKFDYDCIDYGIQPMVIPQGKTIFDMVDCIKKYIYLDFKNIALPFHNKFYSMYGDTIDKDISKVFSKYYPILTPDISYAQGRVQFVRDYHDLLKNNFDVIHLLGSHCPLEKKFYNSKDFSSMDTGYPVKLGINNTLLCKESKKPNIIIDDFFHDDISKETQKIILSNISKFKRY